MGRSKDILMEKVEQFGSCRSQSQKGHAVLYGCILWNGHEGEHRRFTHSWKQGEGYEPTAEEIAALESGEVQVINLFGGVPDADDDE